MVVSSQKTSNEPLRLGDKHTLVKGLVGVKGGPELEAGGVTTDGNPRSPIGVKHLKPERDGGASEHRIA